MSREGCKSPANQRKFLEGFARINKFNLWDAEKWSSFNRDEIRKAGGSGLLKYNNGSHIKALMKLYPELILKKKMLFQVYN